MTLRRIRLALIAVIVLAAAPASAKTLCTLVVAHPSGAVLRQEGDCATRVTPASTFKIPLALMGFDAGILTNAHAPVWRWQSGDPLWQEAWKEPTDPARWLAFSVVWYSQRIARTLGAAKLTSYAKRFGYGNADLSGDPGKNNGLERAWIGSSLKISPQEQAAFLGRILSRSLSVSPAAYEGLEAAIEHRLLPGGWQARGKTGAAFPQKPDGTPDRQHGYGWYVGWAENAGRRIVFVRLDQDDAPQTVSPGLRARDAILTELPSLLEKVHP